MNRVDPRMESTAEVDQALKSARVVCAALVAGVVVYAAVAWYLARAGVVESVRGKGGGVRLARAPEEIRVGEIVRTSEGDVPIVECLSGDPHACRITSSCRLKGILVNAFEVLYEALDEYTLADLVEKPRKLTHALIRR